MTIKKKLPIENRPEDGVECSKLNKCGFVLERCPYEDKKERILEAKERMKNKNK